RLPVVRGHHDHRQCREIDQRPRSVLRHGLAWPQLPGSNGHLHPSVAEDHVDLALDLAERTCDRPYAATAASLHWPEEDEPLVAGFSTAPGVDERSLVRRP